MNSELEGERPRIAGRVLSVDTDRRVLVDTDRRVLVDGGPPAAGDGVARALAGLVVDDLAGDAGEQAIAVDQTNTSFVVDRRLVVKLVGRWGAADRAGRLLERLAEARSDDVARLHGRVEWRHPRLGTSTLAVVTEYLPGAEDGWIWAVDDVVAVLDGEVDPDWPALLGTRVAPIHDTLGADARPAGTDAAGRRLARAAGALRRAITAADGPSGARLRNRRDSLERDIRSLGETRPGLEFPIHGDLHVGQVLASPAPAGDAGTRRYTIIDFDGDPALAAAERERPDAAARDIAHLLVSLDLVAAVAQRRAGRVDTRAFDWADRARADLLAAYRAALGRPELFDPALLPGYEAEQLVAELHYADRFLPVWRYAPDAAITYRHQSSNDHPEEPWTPPPFAPTSS